MSPLDGGSENGQSVNLGDGREAGPYSVGGGESTTPGKERIAPVYRVPAANAKQGR